MIFFKMTGSGNDFVFLDGRETTESDWPAERIQQVCDRRTGIGADGLVILSPAHTGVVRMDFFNRDGSRAAMCGNAALCATRLAGRLELVPEESPAGMQLETDAGTFRTKATGPGWTAEINLPPFEAPVCVPGLECMAGEEFIRHSVVGVPHLSVLVDDIESADLMVRGRALRYHPAIAPDGANINFVGRPAGRDDPWPMRTYERGVEEETLACGTGTVATAAALADEGATDLPGTFLSRSGQILSVAARRAESGWVDVWLCGEGRLVFTGEWEYAKRHPETGNG